MVLASFDEGDFCETNAFVMGKTPLRRLMEIPDDGMHVCISQYGHEEWHSRVFPASPPVLAKLKPVAAGQASASQECAGIAIAPVRVGPRLISDEGGELDSGEEAEEYRDIFCDTFRGTIAEQGLKHPPMIKISAEVGAQVWREFEKQMTSHCFERVPYMPERMRLEIPPRVRDLLAESGRYILLMRAEGYYIGGRTRFVRAAAPFVLTAASIAISANNPVGSHTSGNATTTTYAFPVFGAMPSEDHIVIQEVLLNPHTQEIEWCGQISAPAYYRKRDAVESLAKLAAELVPDEFLTQ